MKTLALTLFAASLYAQLPRSYSTMPGPCGSLNEIAFHNVGGKSLLNTCQTDGTWKEEATADQTVPIPSTGTGVIGITTSGGNLVFMTAGTDFATPASVAAAQAAAIAASDPVGAAAAVAQTTNQKTRTLGVSFDGGGSPLAGTITRCTPFNFGGTIQSATLTADVSGSATVDVRLVSYASYTGPSSATTITASATPALSSAVKSQNTTLTGWTTAITPGVACFVLSSPSTVTNVSLSLKVLAN